MTTGIAPRRNLWARLVRRLGFARWYPRLARHTAKLDLLVHRLSRGRLLASRTVVPSIVLVHTGRRSGLTHRTPVSAIAAGDGFAVGDGSFGWARRPDWSRNLAANADALVVSRGRRILVRARRAAEEERPELERRFYEHWPAARLYPERAGRDVWIWVLEPRAPEGPG